MALYQEIGAGCSSGCPFCPKKSLPVAPHLPTSGIRLIAVAESPRSFHGLWTKGCEIAGVNQSEVATLSVRACNQPKIGASKPQYKAALEACKPAAQHLLAQLLASNPEAWIFVQGEAALNLVTGRRNVTKWLGPMESGGRDVFVSFDPLQLRTPRDKANTPIWLRHLGWAWQLSTGRMQRWKWPTIHIDWNDATRRAMFELESATRLGCDIETSGISQDSTIRCISFAANGVAVCLPWDVMAPWHPWILKMLGSDRELVWQNGGFDRKMLRRWGVKLGPNHEDLMLMHAIMRPQEFHGLAHIGGSNTWAEAWKENFHADKDEY